MLVLGVSMMIKVLSLFFSIENIFYMTLSKDCREAVRIVEEKYFNNFEYKNVKIPLIKIILQDEEGILFKEDKNLIYEKKNTRIVYPFILTSIELSQKLIIRNETKEMTFFLKNDLYRILYKKPKKEKKSFSFISYDQNPERCLELDDDCNVIKNTCYRCTFGSFPIYTTKCEKYFDRICGPTLCGEYNNYACLRGYQYKSNIKSGCQTGSKEVFCKKSLTAYCRDNTLICL